jgi:predicted RNA-binding Zn ribbon-like protein
MNKKRAGISMLWDDFMNSEWHDWRGSGKSEDRLDKPEWLNKWLESHRLSVDNPPSSNELAALKQLRSLLQQMVKDIVAGLEIRAEDIAALNKHMADAPVIRKVTMVDRRYKLSLNAVSNDWHQVMADIAASFAHILVEAEPSRIRICDNPDCLWIYYDDTRNRSKKYCDDKCCGNLMKVRRFRARQKAAATKLK